MKNKFKIRAWVLIVIGVILRYLISPILARIFLTSTIKSNLIEKLWLVVSLSTAGDILIAFGIIIFIINLFRSKSNKNNSLVYHNKKTQNKDNLSNGIMNIDKKLRKGNLKEKFNKWRNKYKLTVPISIIMTCIILSGLIYKIQVNKQRSVDIQQSERCAELGQKYIEVNYKNNDSLIEFNYHFNKKLNTCLVYKNLFIIRDANNLKSGLNRDSKFVVDILTNQVLIENSIEAWGSALSNDDERNDFNKEKNILMSE